MADFPYFGIEFDKRGEVLKPAQVDALQAFCSGGSVSDLLVLSHGWNNDMAQAEALYRKLLTSIRGQLAAVPNMAERDIVVVAIFWPSKKFAERDLIPGGAAGHTFDDGVSESDLRAQLDDLTDEFSDAEAADVVDQAKTLVGELQDSQAAQRQFVNLLRDGLLPEKDARQDDEADAEMPPELWTLPGDDLLQRMSEAPVPVDEFDPDIGGAAVGVAGVANGQAGMDEAGGAAGLGDLFGGVREGARNLLNMLTYYKMKNRAGVVGARGVYALLHGLRQIDPSVRLHLVGHSFGGRLLSAAAKGAADDTHVAFDSMTLLQAAFSHYGFADQWDPTKKSPGFFRRVLSDNRLRGALVITHTANDRAVGIAYALASRVAGQVAAAIGDEDDIYGGIGRNGALSTPEAENLTMRAPTGGAYEFLPGKVYNLNADQFINDHSDVAGSGVAFAIVNAMSLE